MPAGYFEGAQRKDGKTTTWLHPDVPLGAVVQVRAGDREDTLVAYGLGDDVEELAKPKPKPRRYHFLEFYELGLVAGYRSQTPGSTHVDGFSFSACSRSTDDLDLMLSVTGIDNRRHVSSDAEQTSTAIVLGSVRWHPFGRRFSSVPIGIPYVDVGVGYAGIGGGGLPRGDGLAGGARIGWELTEAWGWAFALQGEYIVDHTFGDVSGTHQLVDGTFAIRLQLP